MTILCCWNPISNEVLVPTWRLQLNLLVRSTTIVCLNFTYHVVTFFGFYLIGVHSTKVSHNPVKPLWYITHYIEWETCVS